MEGEKTAKTCILPAPDFLQKKFFHSQNGLNSKRLLHPPPVESIRIFQQFMLNDASVFGALKGKLREKRAKIGTNALILNVDSHFLLIYSHRYIQSWRVQTQTTLRKNSAKRRRRKHQAEIGRLFAASS
jgi:hypothetical protein